MNFVKNISKKYLSYTLFSKFPVLTYNYFFVMEQDTFVYIYYCASKYFKAKSQVSKILLYLLSWFQIAFTISFLSIIFLNAALLTTNFL